MFNPILIAKFPAIFDSKEFLKNVLNYATVEEIIKDILEDKINDKILNSCLTHGIGSFGTIEHDIFELAEKRIYYSLETNSQNRKKLFMEIFGDLYLSKMEEYSYAEYFFSFIVAKYIIAFLPHAFTFSFAEAESSVARTFLVREYTSNLDNFKLIFSKIGINSIRRIDEVFERLFLPETYEIAISVPEYLKYTYSLKTNISWKLYNRLVIKGYVILKLDEAVRIFKEHYKTRIIETTPTLRDPPFEDIKEIVNKLLEKYAKRFEKKIIKIEDKKLEFNPEAFPPCMRNLYDRLLLGENLSHQERFNLAAFLCRIGLSVDQILEIFSHAPDFNEKIARYQIEHIAGLRGSCKKYMPANCRTLQALGICKYQDELCKKVKNPLVYYIKKLKLLKQKEVNK